MKHVLLGGGGHARALVDILMQKKISIDFLIGRDTENFFRRYLKIKILDSDLDILKYCHKEISLINGLGPQPFSSKRRVLIEFFEEKGYDFKKIIASSAYVSPFSDVSDGCQIMQNSVINNSTIIGKHSVINTGAIVEHDVIIGEHSFIGPNSTLCGGVKVGENVFIGAGATIFPGINIENNAVISGGTVVNRNVVAKEVYK